jgi:cation diffusion facilitator CzcD-associated flavoprotein CzcO
MTSIAVVGGGFGGVGAITVLAGAGHATLAPGGRS